MASMLVLSDPRASSDPFVGRSFKVFEQLTAHSLSGILEMTLWHDVLRAAQHSDALFHAATALGSAHEAYLHRQFNMETPEEDRALQQYNKAIRMLTKRDAQDAELTPDVVITSSIMFMTIEMMRREYGKAIKHLKAGIGIFAEHHGRTASDGQAKPTLIPTERLEDILRQLETHLCEISMDGPLSMPRRSLVSYKELPRKGEAWASAPAGLDQRCFDSITEARAELDSYCHNLMFLFHEILEPDVFATPPASEAYTERTTDAFAQAFVSWRHRFDGLKAKLAQRPRPLSRPERRTLAQLEMYHLVASQVLTTYLSLDEMSWDKHQAGFERVLDLCDVIVGKHAGGVDKSGGSDNDDAASEAYNGFQLNHGIVAACLHTAWKCRDARVRLRVIDLLSQQRQEGLWDAQLVKWAVCHIDEIERGPGLLEAAALRGDGADVIPRWRRIVRLDVYFSAEGRGAVLVLFVPKDESMEITTIKKVLSW
ncbi:hypothetical protein, variant [Verruconis gallopava]|nr:hypothetical protein, variant [Verruconis gallopava]KIW08657.1 hypothetical protein, variant [Verruconis gallopava]